MSARREARAALEAANKKEKSTGHYVLTGISAGLLLVVIAIAVLVIVVPMLTGSTPRTVLTSSMEPGLPPGTLVIDKPVDPADVRIGDVVTYQLASGQDLFVTHRVISISRSTSGDITFITKGDNNAAPDAAPVSAEQLQSGGRVWYSIPWIGWLNNAVGGSGKSWLVIGAAVLLFGYAGWQFLSGLLDRKPKRQASAAPPEP